MTSILTHSMHSTMLKKVSETAVPDSTTSLTLQEMSDFSTGQDVLVKQKDGRYYFGTVVEVDSISEQCLIKFGDNTDNWSLFKDLTKLSNSEHEDLLCVVCKKSAPKRKNEITVCDQCGRGYHQKCHFPEIPTVDVVNCQKEESSWICKRCTESDPLRLRKNDNTKNLRRDSLRNSSSDSQIVTSRTVKALPYELSSLNWDTYHRVNSEQIYCYCGGSGEWYKQMLQCGRCKQWFHEKCIDCLQFPLYCGDRFYVFVCSICNHGRDFVRRLEMKWVDLVHLMLFNLTVYNCKKYYDLDTVVIPYITDNWHALQLPPKIANISKAERRENILSVLTNNRNRFKCGREIKKRTTIWGLRVRLPPPAPCVTLPPNGRVTEDELRDLWQGNRRLQFLPRLQASLAPSKHLICDVTMKNLMMGVAYQQSHALSETDSPCPSPEIIKEEEQRITMGVPKFVAKKNEYLGAGCAKKTAPFKKMSLQRRKKLLAMSNRERERILKRPKRFLANNKDNKNSSNVDNVSQSLPPTPPTSVSAPPTPPASNATSAVSTSDLSNDFVENTHNKVGPLKKAALGVDFEPNTPCDTSGDETSSKSTLDLIIPPPKDFEGKNNPFLTLLRVNSFSEEQKNKGRKNKEITLPLPLKTVIPGKPQMRPMKRQLSEKDIVIGPNGEIKRRKRVRRTRNVAPNYVASKTAAVVPVKPSETKEWKNNQSSSTNSQIGHCVDYAFNGRRLRQRPEKPPDKEKASATTATNSNSTTNSNVSTNQQSGNTPKPSPVKQEPNIDIDDLKTSVNMYFGAANRITLGERFAVRAKRLGPTGKMEYLIEWEGPSNNGMT